MSAWTEIEEHLTVIGSSSYSTDQRDKDRAKAALRRAFLALEVKADERDELRQMLVDQGIENARQAVEIQQGRERESLTPPEPPITEVGDPRAPEVEVTLRGRIAGRNPELGLIFLRGCDATSGHHPWLYTLHWATEFRSLETTDPAPTTLTTTHEGATS